MDPGIQMMIPLMVISCHIYMAHLYLFATFALRAQFPHAIYSAMCVCVRTTIHFILISADIGTFIRLRYYNEKKNHINSNNI